MNDWLSVKKKVNLIREEEVPEGAKGALQTFLMNLPVPKKVELAARGNKEVRLILSRDASSMVARAVIASPRLGEADILTYASSPLTNEEILRAIGENREWMSNSRLLSVLVSNPRTPPPLVLKLLPRLPKNGLAQLSRNPNVSMVVRREAKRILISSRT